MQIKALSEMLGHSTVKITMDRYVHLSMSFKQSQITILQFPDSESKTRQNLSQTERKVLENEEDMDDFVLEKKILRHSFFINICDRILFRTKNRIYEKNLHFSYILIFFVISTSMFSAIFSVSM